MAKLPFESEEQAAFRERMLDDAVMEFPSMKIVKKPVVQPPKPNRKQRRAHASRMKKRVKQLIKSQEKRNARRIKANSSSDDRPAGIGEVDVGQVFL